MVPFRLLTLRGGVAVGGSWVRDPILERGLTLEFAPGLALTVTEVRLPDFALALTGPGLELVGVLGVCSLVLSPTVRLRRGHRSDADAWLTTGVLVCDGSVRCTAGAFIRRRILAELLEIGQPVA